MKTPRRTIPRATTVPSRPIRGRAVAAHWTTIGLRLEQAYPHVPIFASRLDPWRGRRWAAAFFSDAIRRPNGALRIGEEAIGVLPAP